MLFDSNNKYVFCTIQQQQSGLYPVEHLFFILNTSEMKSTGAPPKIFSF